MIYSLNGKLIYTDKNFAVIECGGVGYRFLATMNTLRKLPAINEDAFVYTHMLIREDSVELCGFADKSELNCFRLLTSINGVGAKVAISILSELTPEKIALAVSSNDIKSLTKAAGVGNKLAQRIILELKDKVKNMIPLGTVQSSNHIVTAGGISGGNISEALGALAVLGYAPDEAMIFMQGIDPNLPVERIIGETLKAIGKKK